MLLLCTSDGTELAAIRQPSSLAAIRKGRVLIAIWADHPCIASQLEPFDELMLAKGIFVTVDEQDEQDEQAEPQVFRKADTEAVAAGADALIVVH
ncbi:hypothetical protein LTR93_011346 [Exophiala xenobiotica]|nr:hypothetical protein LTR93_011346 [Exophiala xenobiotica]